MNFCDQALLTQRLAAFYTFLTRAVLSFEQMVETMSGFGKRQNGVLSLPSRVSHE